MILRVSAGLNVKYIFILKISVRSALVPDRPACPSKIKKSVRSASVPSRPARLSVRNGGFNAGREEKIILPPSQIISHSKNFGESKFFKFDQIYIAK
jgi:hypothetical protein